MRRVVLVVVVVLLDALSMFDCVACCLTRLHTCINPYMRRKLFVDVPPVSTAGATTDGMAGWNISLVLPFISL